MLKTKLKLILKTDTTPKTLML